MYKYQPSLILTNYNEPFKSLGLFRTAHGGSLGAVSSDTDVVCPQSWTPSMGYFTSPASLQNSASAPQTSSEGLNIK